MPPAGAPRPDQADVRRARHISGSHRSIATRWPRRIPASCRCVHRLSRTEYQNAIRDLLAIDALPKEIDYPLLLPADNSASGFDNIADLLFMSPAIMERYLDAAEKISRLAVGDTNAPVMVNRYRLHPEQWQGARVDELPWGTRGGLAVKSDFPVDGEYLDQGRAGRAGRRAASARDHRRRRAPAGRYGRRPGWRTGGRGRSATAAAARGAASRSQTGRSSSAFRSKPGPRLVGVTFVERDEVRDESTLRPRMRGRGNEPALSLVTISGPYGAKTPGDSPSRRRIFVCRLRPPTARRRACAQHPARRWHAAPIGGPSRTPIFRICCRSTREAGRGAPRLRPRHRARARAAARQPAVSVSRRARAAPGVRAGRARSASATSSSRRACRSFSGAAFRTTQLLNVAATGQLKSPAVLEREVRRMLARSAVGVAGHQLRRAVAVRARHRGQAARRPRSSPTSTKRCARPCARDRALPRQRPAREPQRRSIC